MKSSTSRDYQHNSRIPETGHFEDILPSQSLSKVQKKLNLIQQKQQQKNKMLYASEDTSSESNILC